MATPARPEPDATTEASIALVQAAAHAGDFPDSLMGLCTIVEILSEDILALRAHVRSLEDAIDDLRREIWN